MPLRKSKDSPFKSLPTYGRKPQKIGKPAESNSWIQSHSDGSTASVSADRRTIQRPRVLQVLGTAFILVMLAFGGKLFALQIQDGGRYRELANGNRVRQFVEYAERGAIYDRNSKPLTETSVGYQVNLSPYQLPRNVSERTAIYNQLAAKLDIPVEEIVTRVEKQGINYVLPIAIGSIIDQDNALSLGMSFDASSGVNVDVIPQRMYTSEYGIGNILGYTSLVNEQDLESSDHLSLVDYVGRSGIEQQYDDVLRGENGFRRYEVDALGKPIRLIASAPAQAGTDIYLALDYNIQKSLAEGIQREAEKAPSKRGSGVVVHPDSGEVLAMVTYPWYDNNKFVGGISYREYRALADNKNQPLYNKVIAGGYPSGSVIKPLIASAALQENVVDENTVIRDDGYIIIPNQFGGGGFRFDGWNPAGLGALTVRSAIAKSSNIYFFTVGGGSGNIAGLGADRLTNYYKHFGLGEESGIDLPGEQPGRVPTPAWKKEFSGQEWYQGDTYNISIGQGDLLISPLQMNMASNAIANGGYLLQPRMLLRTADEDAPRERIVRRKLDISDKNLQIVREGMEDVPYRGVVGPWRFANIPVLIAGKTGTAETKSTQDQITNNHGWFVAYAPIKNPELTSTVLIEEGGGGSAAAVPALVNMLEVYFSKPQIEDSATLSLGN